MLFAHGFGYDQTMWRHVAPQFENTSKVTTFDYHGAGESDFSAYDPDKYAKLDGYAADVDEIGEELNIENGIFVGHPVSAMIGASAALQRPTMFSTLVMVGSSPRYIDDTDYVGGFSGEDIDDLLNRRRTIRLLGLPRWALRSSATQTVRSSGTNWQKVSASLIRKLPTALLARHLPPTIGPTFQISLQTPSYCSAAMTSSPQSRWANTSVITSPKVSL